MARHLSENVRQRAPLELVRLREFAACQTPRGWDLLWAACAESSYEDELAPVLARLDASTTEVSLDARRLAMESAESSFVEILGEDDLTPLPRVAS